MILAVLRARFAVLVRINPGGSWRARRRAAIRGASLLPRPDSGRSWSASPTSSQLDFAWRSRISRFTGWRSQQAGFEPCLLGHHRLIPRRVENELDFGPLD